MKLHCMRCRYYEPIVDSGTPEAPVKRGECNRYPPQICVDLSSRKTVVLADWWCGEFATKSNR